MKMPATVGLVAGLMLVGGASARAQYDERPTVTRGSGQEHLHTPMGTSIQVGGGVTSFSRQSARDLTAPGGYWDARAVVGTRTIVALELAYVGNASGINAPGLDPGAVLIGNGAESDLRLQAPLVASSGMLVEPFVFGGIGWVHYDVRNDSYNHSIVKEQDNVGTIPFGSGVAFGWRGFMLEARFTYRQTYNEDLFPTATESGRADLQNWSAGAMLGFEL
jgi:hypothetical protein